MKSDTETAFERGVNFKKRVITISGDINRSAFKMLDVAMTEMESASKAAIIVRINSLGGEVLDALAMIGRIKSSKCKVITEGYGAVMSSAIGLLAAGSVRRCSKYAIAMSHEASYSVEGRHSDAIKEVKQRAKEEKIWCEMMESFTSKTADWWSVKHKQGDLYLTAQQLLEAGVIDEIF